MHLQLKTGVDEAHLYCEWSFRSKLIHMPLARKSHFVASVSQRVHALYIYNVTNYIIYFIVYFLHLFYTLP